MVGADQSGPCPACGTDCLTVPEVGKRLRLSRAAIYALIRSGELPSVQVGRGARRVLVSDLINYLRGLRR